MPTSKIIKEDIYKIILGIRDESFALEGKTILISGGAGFLGKYFMGVFNYLNDSPVNRDVNIFEWAAIHK